MAVKSIISTDLFPRCFFLTTFGQMTRRGQVVCSGVVALPNFAFARLVPKRYQGKDVPAIYWRLTTNQSGPHGRSKQELTDSISPKSPKTSRVASGSNLRYPMDLFRLAITVPCRGCGGNLCAGFASRRNVLSTAVLK